MDSEKSQKEPCDFKAYACGFTAIRQKPIPVRAHRQHLQYLFVEQLDISVSLLLQLVSDLISISMNGLIKHFMTRGELSKVILTEMSKGHKCETGFIKWNQNPAVSNMFLFQYHNNQILWLSILLLCFVL